MIDSLVVFLKLGDFLQCKERVLNTINNNNKKKCNNNNTNSNVNKQQSGSVSLRLLNKITQPRRTNITTPENECIKHIFQLTLINIIIMISLNFELAKDEIYIR